MGREVIISDCQKFSAVSKFLNISKTKSHIYKHTYKYISQNFKKKNRVYNIYVYIYVERGRARERERETFKDSCLGKRTHHARERERGRVGERLLRICA